MSTTRSDKWTELGWTLLLGLVMALCVAFLAGSPEMAWLGFALAATLAAR